MLRSKLMFEPPVYGYIATSKGSRGAVGGDYTLTVPAAAEYGDLLILTITVGDYTGMAFPDGWTAIDGSNSPSGGASYTKYTTYSASTDLTATLTLGDGPDVAWMISAYRGYSFVSCSKNTATGTNPDHFTRTITSTLDYIHLSVGRQVSINIMTEPSGYTDLGAQGSGAVDVVDTANRTGISPGVHDPGNWTYASSTYWQTYTILLSRS